MIVVLRVLGNLDKYFGGSEFNIELQEGASFRDLLNSIAMKWGRALPPHVWDVEDNKFKPGVLCCDGKNDLTDDRVILSNMQEIILTLPIAGG
jgi:hypothetical protein